MASLLEQQPRDILTHIRSFLSVVPVARHRLVWALMPEYDELALAFYPSGMASGAIYECTKFHRGESVHLYMLSKTTRRMQPLATERFLQQEKQLRQQQKHVLFRQAVRQLYLVQRWTPSQLDMAFQSDNDRYWDSLITRRVAGQEMHVPLNIGSAMMNHFWANVCADKEVGACRRSDVGLLNFMRKRRNSSSHSSYRGFLCEYLHEIVWILHLWLWFFDPRYRGRGRRPAILQGAP